MPKVRTFFWFDDQAEEAAKFYCSVFKDSKLVAVTRHPDSKNGSAGEVMTVEFELAGHPITALNAGPQDEFNTALSLLIETKDQAETDYYWTALTADGGEEKPCGWLKDKYGVFWQVEPRVLPDMLADPDRKAASRVHAAMLKMGRIVIADLEAARAGR